MIRAAVRARRSQGLWWLRHFAGSVGLADIIIIGRRWLRNGGCCGLLSLLRAWAPNNLSILSCVAGSTRGGLRERSRSSTVSNRPLQRTNKHYSRKKFFFRKYIILRNTRRKRTQTHTLTQIGLATEQGRTGLDRNTPDWD